MSYPEKGAGYRHQPKFLDRALADEKRADGGAVDKYDPASAGFQERNQKAAQDAADHARINPISDADKDRIESQVAAPKRAAGGDIEDGDDDDDIDLTAGTEVDDEDDLPELPPRHRRGTQTTEKD